MNDTAIIDATTRTVVSLQSFLSAGSRLPEERSCKHPERMKCFVSIPELVCSLNGTSFAVPTRRDQGQFQQVATHILADMNQNVTALIAAKAGAISAARGVLNYSLHTLQNYRRAALDLACRPIGGRQISEVLQLVVCGAVVRGTLSACDALDCSAPVDAARLRATNVILAEILRQLHTEYGTYCFRSSDGDFGGCM